MTHFVFGVIECEQNVQIFSEESDYCAIAFIDKTFHHFVIHEVLTGVETWSQGETYAQSKLALTMWSFYLAKREPDINAIAVNPGSLLNTNMVKEAFGNYWSSADKGAKILYELAISDDYQDARSKYFDNDKGAFAKAHPDAYNEKQIDKLIATTIKILAN